MAGKETSYHGPLARGRRSVRGDIALGLRTGVGVAAMLRAGAVVMSGAARFVTGAGVLGFVIAIFALARAAERQRSCAHKEGAG